MLPSALHREMWLALSAEAREALPAGERRALRELRATVWAPGGAAGPPATLPPLRSARLRARLLARAAAGRAGPC